MLIEWLEGYEYSLQRDLKAFWIYAKKQAARKDYEEKVAYMISGFLARFWIRLSTNTNIDFQVKNIMQNWTLEQVHQLRNHLQDLPKKPAQALQQFSMGVAENWLRYAPY